MEHFQALIHEVETNYRPQCEYSKLPDEILSILLVLADCSGIYCVARILAAAKSEWPRKEIVRKSLLLAFNPNENNLAWLSKQYPYEEPLRFLVELRLNVRDINKEMLKRSASHKLGRAMLVALVTNSEKPLKKELLKSRDGGKTLKKRTWSPDKDVQEDREAEAIGRAWKFFDKLTASAIKGVEGNYLPALPESIKVPDAPAWLVNYLAAKFKDILDKALRSLKPILDGRAERMAKSAHQTVRNKIQTLNRRKSILAGTNHFPKQGSESWRADWDFSKSAITTRSAELQNETMGRTSIPEDVLSENQTRREDLKETLRVTTRAYELAAKRSGKKGIIFLDELKAGKTEIEAANSAKMSDRTGRRILEAIRQSHMVTIPIKTAR